MRDREPAGDVDQPLEARGRANAVDERRERVEARPAFDLGVHGEDVQIVGIAGEDNRRVRSKESGGRDQRINWLDAATATPEQVLDLLGPA